LSEVFSEFKENNTVGAYSLLVAMVDPHSKKLVKSQEAREAMHHTLSGVSSYVEVDLEAKTNLQTLDLHLRYVMDPACCQHKMHELSMEELVIVVSRPLFETLPVLKKKKPQNLIKQRKLS
jgi:hypothetical protein